MFSVKYSSVVWLLILIQHVNLIDVRLGEDQRTNTIKTHIWKRLDYVSCFNNHSILNNEHNSKDLSTNMHF